MKGLYDYDIEDWCLERNLVSVDDWRQCGNPSLVYSDTLYTSDSITKDILAEAASISSLEVMGKWDECLLWVRETGIFASCENWPAFFALRGEDNVLSSLGEQSGHLFTWEERGRLGLYLAVVMGNLWDALVLPSINGAPETIRIATSHDEAIDLWSSTPRKFPPLVVSA